MTPSTPHTNRTQSLIQAHAFRTLFVEELGWDRLQQALRVEFRGHQYDLIPIAQKRGLAVFECVIDPLKLRDRALLRGIQRHVKKSAHEHIVVYTDPGKTRQVWQWVTRVDETRGHFHREHPFTSFRPPEEFLSRLQSLRVGLDEEEGVSLVKLTRTVATSFDRGADETAFFQNPRFMYESHRLAADLASGGVPALHKFINYHDGLAKWAAGGFRHTGVDEDDLQQMARLGLIEAAKRYDPSRGATFGTYAFYWLRQTVMRHVPSHYLAASLRTNQFWPTYRYHRRAERKFAIDGRQSEEAWLDRHMTSDSRIGEWHLDIRRIWNPTSIHESPQTRRAARLIRDPGLGPGERVAYAEDMDVLRSAIRMLDSVDSLIVQRRFGIDAPEQTLKEVGETVGLTRERIRQLEKEALQQLRKSLCGHFESFAPNEHASAANASDAGSKKLKMETTGDDRSGA